MLEPILAGLNTKRIVLASSSPRRASLLQNIGLKIEVIASNYKEVEDPGVTPERFAINTALCKVKEVYHRLKSSSTPPDIIIGADTVVVLDKKIYGKPKDEKDAFEMLKKLSGREHAVHTGVVILRDGSSGYKFFETTKVFVGDLTSDIISSYIKTKDPMDKAGSYGIQGIGGTIIKKIEGDFYNVMGLPLHSLSLHLLELYSSQELNEPVYFKKDNSENITEIDLK